LPTYRRTMMNDTIRDFLTKPGTLEAALEIEAYLADVKKWLFQTFWEGVGRELQQRLDIGGHHHLWLIQYDDDLFQRWHGFGIAWRDGSNTPRFSIRTENLVGRGSPAIYGISRGMKLLPESPIHASESLLKIKLHESGFTRETEWWPAYRYFYDHQLPRFDFSSAADLILLSQDVQDAERPLTRCVADRIWQLFDAYHVHLENLNHVYPYYLNFVRNRGVSAFR
jgi:hypothetical protein